MSRMNTDGHRNIPEGIPKTRIERVVTFFCFHFSRNPESFWSFLFDHTTIQFWKWSTSMSKEFVTKIDFE